MISGENLVAEQNDYCILLLLIYGWKKSESSVSPFFAFVANRSRLWLVCLLLLYDTFRKLTVSVFDRRLKLKKDTVCYQFDFFANCWCVGLLAGGWWCGERFFIAQLVPEVILRYITGMGKQPEVALVVAGHGHKLILCKYRGKW